MTHLLLADRWQLEWHVISRGLETVSGDLEVIAPFDTGILLATLDGLGHGPGAAHASEAAAAYLKSHRADPLDLIFMGCHQSIRNTRGVVMSVATFDAQRGEMTWAGVGNVEASLFQAESGEQEATSQGLVPRPGVVGYQMSSIRSCRYPVTSGDLLVMATDGIEADFEGAVLSGGNPEDVANRVFERHARISDDALILVVRFEELSEGHSVGDRINSD